MELCFVCRGCSGISGKGCSTSIDHTKISHDIIWKDYCHLCSHVPVPSGCIARWRLCDEHIRALREWKSKGYPVSIYIVDRLVEKGLMLP